MWVLLDPTTGLLEPRPGRSWFWNPITNESRCYAPEPVKWQILVPQDGKSSYFKHLETGQICSPLELGLEAPGPGAPGIAVDCCSVLERLERCSSRLPGDFPFFECYRGAGVLQGPAPSSPRLACRVADEPQEQCWVMVFDQYDKNELQCYWDTLSGATAAKPPAGQKLEWFCRFSASLQRWYYCNLRTKESTFAAPGAIADEAPTCERGQTVRLGPGAGERYCGQVAWVASIFSLKHKKAGMVTVKFPRSQGGAKLDVPKTAILPLAVGDIVDPLRTDGQPSGKASVVVSAGKTPFDDIQVLRLDTKEFLHVRSTQVVPRSRLVSFKSTQESLQHREPQDVTFFCSGGIEHGLVLNLPHGLDHRCSKACCSHCSSEKKSWPLLVYMHGSGGGSLIDRSKNNRRAVGLNWATERFVVVSPKCQWKWKEEPNQWVLELVRHLRAFDFIDPNRVYLTGCSMGGMSTWELAAAAPELFAAIAPVAAHHKATREDYLARQLVNMPVFAVSAPGDDTCPFAQEERLWNLLISKGNTKVQLMCAKGIVHCKMFERAYYPAPDLFAWLLRYRLGGSMAAERQRLSCGSTGSEVSTTATSEVSSTAPAKPCAVARRFSRASSAASSAAASSTSVSSTALAAPEMNSAASWLDDAAASSTLIVAAA
eukprot:TRINITY_DN30312_c0_g1_i1.p1 TRINITY_DN30312_c0_g1~~TRINITY_DN30312_c0_g1_i1.p1  ORF type:complete len:657 (-),score=119.24 TRINITY_DN30312_c0_g1_i1:111-2081(-)